MARQYTCNMTGHDDVAHGHCNHKEALEEPRQTKNRLRIAADTIINTACDVIMLQECTPRFLDQGYN